jgi:sensor histidine kinase regulating citrate/malate metabolism
VRVRVSLEGGDLLRLRVCDSGSPVPPEVERNLLRGPVRSAGGLGIGLYQAARQAEAAGYVLELESNREDDVCFTLSGPPG